MSKDSKRNHSGGIKLCAQKVRSMSASCPANEGAGNSLRRRVGERFHGEAYALWASGDVFEEVARKCGKSERQVRRWALAERWKERLQATQRKALAKLEEKHADRLV